MADHDPEAFDELLSSGTKLYAAVRTTAAAAVYREALAKLTAIAEQYPGNAALHHAAAQINNSLGRRADAAAAARTALAADSGHTSAWHEQALAHGPEENIDLRGELEGRLAMDDLSDKARRT